MLLGMCTSVSAQESWGLQDCIDYALKNNIQIQKNRINEGCFMESQRCIVSQPEFQHQPEYGLQTLHASDVYRAGRSGDQHQQ